MSIKTETNPSLSGANPTLDDATAKTSAGAAAELRGVGEKLDGVLDAEQLQSVMGKLAAGATAEDLAASPDMSAIFTALRKGPNADAE